MPISATERQNLGHRRPISGKNLGHCRPISATERNNLGHRRFKGWLGCSSSVRLAEIDAPSRPGATAILSKDKEEIPSQLRSKRSSGCASSDPTSDIPTAAAATAGVPISATERQNLGHRRLEGWLGSSSVRLAEIDAPSRPGATAILTKDKEVIPGQLGSKRSSGGASSDPTWIILNRIGARKDFFCGDRTTSKFSHTSSGEQISVSLELVEPPMTSLLILHWPRGPHPMKSTLSYPKIIAADRNAVLFQMTSCTEYPYTPMDYFIYRMSSDHSQPPSLSRLPVCYKGTQSAGRLLPVCYKGTQSAGRLLQRHMSTKGTGLLCCSTGSLIVAELEIRSDSPLVNIYMLWPRSNDRKWQVFERLPVRCANYLCADSGSDLLWWSTDAVVPFRSCYLVWVDYYKGMIIGKMDKCYLYPHKPELQYVSLPVDPIRGDPDSVEYGRGCPEASRSLCVAGSRLKFVIVNQHSSSFSITLWSMSDDYSWREEATLDADQLWALDSKKTLPHVRPEFPVVNMENPEAVCFLLDDDADYGATTWMIEVHMKERRLLDVAYYSKKVSLSGQNTYMTARKMSEGCSFISSQLPRYVPEQAMKRKLTKREYA